MTASSPSVPLSNTNSEEPTDDNRDGGESDGRVMGVSRIIGRSDGPGRSSWGNVVWTNNLDVVIGRTYSP